MTAVARLPQPGGSTRATTVDRSPRARSTAGQRRRAPVADGLYARSPTPTSSTSRSRSGSCTATWSARQPAPTEVDALLCAGRAARRTPSSAGGRARRRCRAATRSSRSVRQTTAGQSPPGRGPSRCRYARAVGSLPFVRMVAVTGALAVGNADPGATSTCSWSHEPAGCGSPARAPSPSSAYAARQGHDAVPQLLPRRARAGAGRRTTCTPRTSWPRWCRSPATRSMRQMRAANRVGRGATSPTPPRHRAGRPRASSRPDAARRALAGARFLRTPLGDCRRGLGAAVARSPGSGQMAAARSAGEASFAADRCKGHFDGHARAHPGGVRGARAGASASSRSGRLEHDRASSLGQSYYLRFDPKLWAQMQPYPPLGTLYAAAHAARARLRGGALRRDAGRVRGGVGGGARPRAAALRRPLRGQLQLPVQDVPAAHARGRLHDDRAWPASAAARVIVAAPTPPTTPPTYLAHGADVRARRRGRRDPRASCSDRARARHGAGRSRRVAGLAFRRPTATLVTHAAPPGHQATSTRCPFPAWDLVDVERYRAHLAASATALFSMNMVTTRGCPFHCNWCAKPIWGQRYNVRSPENVAAELALAQAHATRPTTSGSPTTSSACGPAG